MLIRPRPSAPIVIDVLVGVPPAVPVRLVFVADVHEALEQ